jgi:hypothetical protein
MLSTAEQEALKARTDAVEAYTAAIQKNERVLKERKPLEERKDTLETKQTN